MSGSLQILSFKLGQLKTNSYIVADENTKEAIIVDPADSGEFLTNKLSAHELTPKAALATHGHFDHILAATHVKLALEIPFLIHKKDEFLLDRMQESATYFTGIDPGPKPTVDNYLKDGQTISLGGLSIEVIHTPGHTPGSVSLSVQKSCFVGDLVFPGGGVGRVDFKYSDKGKIEKSIQKILSLDQDTVLYPGHGEAGLTGDERKLNHLYKSN